MRTWKDLEVKQKIDKSGLPIPEIAFAAGLETWNLRNYINGNARWPVGARERVLDTLEKMEQPGKYSDLKEFILDMGFDADSSLSLYQQHEKVSNVVFILFKQRRLKLADAKQILTALVENA